MENLILATRLLVLKSNLEQGVNVLDSLQRRGKELEFLNRLLGRAYGAPAFNVHSAADNIQDIIKKYEGSLPKYQGSLGSSITASVAADIYSAADNIQDIIQGRAKSLRTAKSFQEHEEQLTSLRKEVNAQIDDIRLHLDAARDVVRLMQTRILKIESAHIKDTISHAIVAKASASVSKLEKIQKTLEDAEKAEGMGDSEKAANLMKAAWDEYAHKLELDSQPVLTEYVEFLGGLALRHTGLDAGICQIADELISTVDRIERAGFGPLTIPARYEAVTAEVARIIRFGYPEWTIWALPLVAHQFGHLVVSNRELQDFIGQQSQRHADSFMQHYFADAFAAYTLGPAYACAALFLRLDLSAAYKDKGDQEPAAAKLAYVVFSMLDWVNRNGKEKNQPYAGITETLKKEWEAALGQTNQIGKLGAEEKRQLDEYVDFLGTIAIRIYPTLRPPLWKSVQEWPEKLLQNEGKDISVDGTEEFRDVLNAAWVCRISHRDRSVEIEKAATGLWKRINEIRRGGGNPPWAS